MSYEAARRMLPPGVSRKRKEREISYPSKPFLPPPGPVPVTGMGSTPVPGKSTDPVSSNKLLAGYLAHEFLTKGTILGKKYDPARAIAVPVKIKPVRNQTEPVEKVKVEPECYAEMTNLVKKETHLLGIVNPTQLARWIQM